jgi:hypothetical protein
LSLNTKRAVEKVWRERWDYLHSPIHGAGFCLDPEFHSMTLGAAEGRETLADLDTMVKRLLPDPEQRILAMRQYASFQAGEGSFGLESAAEQAKQLPGHQWWEVYGKGTPELQSVAVKVLAQVSSACGCERNWSTYDFIHSRKRNRLAPGRARDLVWAFTNGRLADKMKAYGHEEDFVGWDKTAEESDQDGEGEDTG